MSNVAKAFQYLVLDPIDKKSPALLPLRVAQLLHDRTGGRSDVYFRRLFGNLRAKAWLPRPTNMSEGAIANSVAALKRRGWDILPFRLDRAAVSEIRAFAFSTPAYAENPAERVRVDESNIPHDHGRYTWRMDELTRVPAVQTLLRDSTLPSIAQGYLECRPILTSVSIWLDPVYDGKFEPHVYHYDNDGPAFLKFFIYLSDVDADTGAHSFIEKSHGRNKPDKFTRARRYDRGELLEYYGQESEIVFSAPAGTILAEDTSGFHKGTTLRRGYRLLLQLQYAMLDIPHEEEFSANIRRVKMDALDQNIRRISRKFLA